MQLKKYTIIETDEEESRHCALIQVATVDNEVSKGIIFFYFLNIYYVIYLFGCAGS